MKFTMHARDLESMASVCSMAISSRPMRPINECVWLQARMDEGIPMLVMMGKDAGIGIQKVSDRATVIEDGEALVPAKTLLNFLKLMDGEITFSVDGKNQATLKGKGKKVNIACMDGAEFEPGLTAIKDARECKMDGMAWSGLVNSVSHCVSDDQGRVILTGINLSFDGAKAENGAEAVGLDGFRVAIARRGVETNEAFSAVVPGASAKLVEKVIKNAEGVSFRFGNGVMIAEAYDAAVEVSLLAGEYIDYRAILSRHKPTMRVKLRTDDLLNAVKTAMVSASEGKKGLVSFTFLDEDTLQVSAMADKSAAVTDVNCLVEGHLTEAGGTGTESQISFNGKYLDEALTMQRPYGEEIILEAANPVAPMVILPVGRGDCLQLVLPVRTGT